MKPGNASTYNPVTTMKRQIGPTFLLAATLLATGCGSFLRQGVSLDEFEYGELTHGTEISTSIDAQGFSSEVIFVGQFNTPDPCFRITGRVEHSGSNVTLRLTADRTRTGCENILGAFRYAGAIRGLSPGTYQFRIVHEFPGTGWERQELNTSVTVR
jgi:hypothetical protein